MLIAADIPDYVQRPLHIMETNMKSYTMMVYLLTLQTYSWQLGYVEYGKKTACVVNSKML